MRIRLAKYIADCGICSRRKAEQLILQGSVKINNVQTCNIVSFVDEKDIVRIDDVVINKPNKIKLFAFNKPLNVMTTTSDPQGRKIIYDYLPNKYKTLKYIGRLDYKTTGLLLLTNNGEFAKKMMMPTSNIERSYLAVVNESKLSDLRLAKQGITIDGIRYAPMKINVVGRNNLLITLTEGKKNEIRIVLRACGMPVRKLHRISYGPIKLGNLPVGKIIKIDDKIIDELVKSV